MRSSNHFQIAHNIAFARPPPPSPHFLLNTVVSTHKKLETIGVLSGGWGEGNKVYHGSCAVVSRHTSFAVVKSLTRTYAKVKKKYVPIILLVNK